MVVVNESAVMGTIVDMDSPDAQVKARDYSIPDDDYAVKVVEATIGTAKSSGNNVINLTYEIQGDDQYARLKLWETLAITPKALWKIRELLSALGVDGLQGKVDLAEIVPSLEGMWCCVTVKNQEEVYQGVKRRRPRIVKHFKYGDDI